MLFAPKNLGKYKLLKVQEILYLKKNQKHFRLSHKTTTPQDSLGSQATYQANVVISPSSVSLRLGKVSPGQFQGSQVAFQNSINAPS